MLLKFESLLGKSVPRVEVKMKDCQVVYVVADEMSRADVDSA